jgi:hypothetical protein
MPDHLLLDTDGNDSLYGHTLAASAVEKSPDDAMEIAIIQARLRSLESKQARIWNSASATAEHHYE